MGCLGRAWQKKKKEMSWRDSVDWGGWAGSPGPLCGHTSGWVWCGNHLVVVSHTMTGGFQMRVLDDVKTWSLIRPGHESSVRSAQLIRRWGLFRKSAPGSSHWWWGSLDGEAFWVGCGFFFLGERERGSGDGRSPSAWFVFSLDNASFRTTLFMVYIIYWAVEVSLQYLQTIVKGPPVRDALGRHVLCWSFDNLTTSSTQWRQWRGLYTSFRHGLHGAVGMVFYVHVVYVKCYFCYMFSLGTSSGNSDSVRIYRRVIFGKQNWWCVWTSCT